MTEDLDRILADQLHSAKRRLKTYKRLMKLMPDDTLLSEGRKVTEKNVIWLEGLITCPKKKRKKFEINIHRTWSNIVYSVRFYKFFIRRKKR